jgi:hypothetical protein
VPPLFPSFAEIEKLSVEQLREKFDEANEGGQPIQCNFYMDELRRRESSRRERRMLVLTVVIAVLTVAITILTAVNVYAVFSDSSGTVRSPSLAGR